MTKIGLKIKIENSILSSVKSPIWLIQNLRRDRKMFKLVSDKKFQTLLGVTGSGKTFTMANIIEKVQKPTLVLAHNKTLARSAIF